MEVSFPFLQQCRYIVQFRQKEESELSIIQYYRTNTRPVFTVRTLNASLWRRRKGDHYPASAIQDELNLSSNSFCFVNKVNVLFSRMCFQAFPTTIQEREKFSEDRKKEVGKAFNPTQFLFFQYTLILHKKSSQNCRILKNIQPVSYTQNVLIHCFRVSFKVLSHGRSKNSVSCTSV